MQTQIIDGLLTELLKDVNFICVFLTLNDAIFQNGSIHCHSRITKVYLHSEFLEFSAFYHVGFNGSEIV